MKKILLTSFAHKTLDAVNEFLVDDPKKMVAAFIPTAADPYRDKNFVAVDRAKLVEMGFQVIDIDIKNKTQDELEKSFESVDLVLVAGGNVFYLLDHAQKSGFLNILNKLIAKGVIYVGSSAGSVLACPTVAVAQLFDQVSCAPDLTSYEGLGVVDFLIIPHFEKPRYLERMRKTIEEWSGKGYHLYPLTDQQAIIVSGENYRFFEVAE